MNYSNFYSDINNPTINYVWITTVNLITISHSPFCFRSITPNKPICFQQYCICFQQYCIAFKKILLTISINFVFKYQAAQLRYKNFNVITERMTKNRRFQKLFEYLQLKQTNKLPLTLLADDTVEEKGAMQLRGILHVNSYNKVEEEEEMSNLEHT